MTAITFNTACRMPIAAKLQGFSRMVLGAIDSFVAHRAQQTVNVDELRRVRREINRYRRLMARSTRSGDTKTSAVATHRKD
jgi:hypothetical protein